MLATLAVDPNSIITVDIPKDTMDWVLIIAALIGFFFVPGRAIYSQFLQNDKSRLYLAKLFTEAKIHTLYAAMSCKLLNGLERFFGGKLSFQALGKCGLLAYTYPFVFFVLAYSWLDGTSQFSGMSILPAVTEWRVLYLPSYLLFFALIFLVLRSIDKSEKCLAGIEQRGKGFFRSIGFNKKVADSVFRLFMAALTCLTFYFLMGFTLTGYILGLVLGILIGALTFARAGAVVGAGAVSGAIAGAVSVAGAISGAFAGVIAISGAVAVLGGVSFAGAIAFAFLLVFSSAGALTVAFHEAYTTSLFMLFFYLSLPLLNAMLDWCSWAVSRFFLERASKAKSPWIVLLDLALDLIFAVVFMLLLCLLLPSVGIGIDSLYSGLTQTIDNKEVVAQTGWLDYAVAARDDPWGDGILVTLMVVTTLLPTLLHILLGLVSVFITGFFGQRFAMMLSRPDFNNVHAFAGVVWLYAYVAAAGLLIMGVHWLVQGVFDFQIAESLYQFTALFYDLPQ